MTIVGYTYPLLHANPIIVLYLGIVWITYKVNWQPSHTSAVVVNIKRCAKMYTKINGKGFTERNLRGNINAALALMTSASDGHELSKLSIISILGAPEKWIIEIRHNVTHRSLEICITCYPSQTPVSIKC